MEVESIKKYYAPVPRQYCIRRRNRGTFLLNGDVGIFLRMSIDLPLILSIVAVVFKVRADLIAENLALRHQLLCLGDRKSRPRLRRVDRVFWMLLSRFWCGW
jgi:hypothetical protein